MKKADSDCAVKTTRMYNRDDFTGEEIAVWFREK